MKEVNFGFYDSSRKVLRLKTELEKAGVPVVLVYPQDLKVNLLGRWLSTKVTISIIGLSITDKYMSLAQKVREELNILPAGSDQLVSHAISLIGLQAGLWAKDSLSLQSLVIFIMVTIGWIYSKSLEGILGWVVQKILFISFWGLVIFF